MGRIEIHLGSRLDTYKMMKFVKENMLFPRQTVFLMSLDAQKIDEIRETLAAMGVDTTLENSDSATLQNRRLNAVMKTDSGVEIHSEIMLVGSYFETFSENENYSDEDFRNACFLSDKCLDYLSERYNFLDISRRLKDFKWIMFDTVDGNLLCPIFFDNETSRMHELWTENEVVFRYYNFNGANVNEMVGDLNLCKQCQLSMKRGGFGLSYRSYKDEFYPTTYMYLKNGANNPTCARIVKSEDGRSETAYVSRTCPLYAEQCMSMFNK